MGYTAFSQAVKEKGGFRDGGMKRVWAEKEKLEYCTPTCHTQEEPQEVEGRGTVGNRM